MRQSVFGRLAGYEDVNDAERLCRDPAMRWVVGDRAINGSAASASQMGRFETKWLSRPENLAALADVLSQWIDKVRRRRGPKTVILDMDSSESPTYGEQEGSAYNGHVWTTASVQGKNGRSATWSGAVMCSASTDAVRMTAGHDEFRGSGPNHLAAQCVPWPSRVFPIPA